MSIFSSIYYGSMHTVCNSTYFVRVAAVPTRSQTKKAMLFGTQPRRLERWVTHDLTSRGGTSRCASRWEGLWASIPKKLSARRTAPCVMSDGGLAPKRPDWSRSDRKVGLNGRLLCRVVLMREVQKNFVYRFRRIPCGGGHVFSSRSG